MQIEQIHIKNYRVFKDTKILGLSHLCVFLGTNGSGKSTLFDVIGFLSDALNQNVTTAILRRGGEKEVWTRGVDPEKENIFFEIKFRDPKSFQDEGKDPNPLITYSVEIGFSKGKAVVRREILKYRRGRRGLPWRFLDFSEGTGSAVNNEEEYGQENAEEKRDDNLTLSSPDILAIKGLGQFDKFKVIARFRNMLEKWYISNLNIDAARNISETGMEPHLNTTGDNLAQTTKYMREHHPAIFEKLLEKLPKRIPGISKVEAIDSVEGRVVLKFQDENFKDPFTSKFVSDGTIKMFAYMVLLHDPDPHPLMCIERPENFLHHELLEQLAEEIREYAEKGGQVFVSTHSPDLVNALNIDELFLLTKTMGLTKVTSAQENKEVKNLYDEGNKLGWLWRNKYISEANLI